MKISMYINFAILSYITLTTMCMEPADYPQLQLGKLARAPKPTIIGDLYIDSRNSTCYTGSSFKQKLEDAGINPKSFTSQKMPFIPILMMVDKKNGNDGYSWGNNAIPDALDEYEEKQIEATGRKRTLNDWFDAREKKKFPHSLPASLLHTYTTGSVLHLTVYGYPVVATCREHPLSTKSFDEQFNEQIDRFKSKSNFFSDMLNFDKERQELIDAKVLTKKGNRHGKNGFVSMEDLLLEDTKKAYGSAHNYVVRRQMGIKPSYRCTQPQQKIEDEQSSEDSSSSEETQPCIIS